MNNLFPHERVPNRCQMSREETHVKYGENAQSPGFPGSMALFPKATGTAAFACQLKRTLLLNPPCGPQPTRILRGAALPQQTHSNIGFRGSLPFSRLPISRSGFPGQRCGDPRLVRALEFTNADHGQTRATSAQKPSSSPGS